MKKIRLTYFSGGQEALVITNVSKYLKIKIWKYVREVTSISSLRFSY